MWTVQMDHRRCKPLEQCSRLHKKEREQGGAQTFLCGGMAWIKLPYLIAIVAEFQPLLIEVPINAENLAHLLPKQRFFIIDMTCLRFGL